MVCVPQNKSFAREHAHNTQPTRTDHGGKRLLIYNAQQTQEMAGLLINTCNDVVFEGIEELETPNPSLDAPSGGDQNANVVITGNSSDVVFKNFVVGPGAGMCLCLAVVITKHATLTR